MDLDGDKDFSRKAFQSDIMNASQGHCAGSCIDLFLDSQKMQPMNGRDPTKFHTQRHCDLVITLKELSSGSLHLPVPLLKY